MITMWRKFSSDHLSSGRRPVTISALFFNWLSYKFLKCAYVTAYKHDKNFKYVVMGSAVKILWTYFAVLYFSRTACCACDGALHMEL